MLWRKACMTYTSSVRGAIHAASLNAAFLCTTYRNYATHNVRVGRYNNTILGSRKVNIGRYCCMTLGSGVHCSLAVFLMVESLPLLLKPLLRPPPSPLPSVAFWSLAHGNNSSTVLILLSRDFVRRPTGASIVRALTGAIPVDALSVEDTDRCLG